MPRGTPTKTSQRHSVSTQSDPETIHIGKLNGSQVILRSDQWDYIQECLERAGYRLTFKTERLMHGSNEDDVVPGTKAASASA